jgi:hypothetical protein
MTGLVLHFSAALNSTAAQTLAAYSLLAGKVKKHVVTFTKSIRLASAVYDSGAMTVTLLPKSKSKLPKTLELQITAARVTDTLSRPLDNGHNYVVMVSPSGTTIKSQALVGDPTH